MDTADHLRSASPWTGEPYNATRQLLGKLVEELGELTQAAGRCIIQGIGGVHPVTGKPNYDWLIEEMADVENLITIIRNLRQHPETVSRYYQRIGNKRHHIETWIRKIDGTA